MNIPRPPMDPKGNQLNNAREMLMDLVYDCYLTRSDRFLPMIGDLSALFPDTEKAAVKKLEEKLFFYLCDPEGAEDVAELLCAHAVLYSPYQWSPHYPSYKPTA